MIQNDCLQKDVFLLAMMMAWCLDGKKKNSQEKEIRKENPYSLSLSYYSQLLSSYINSYMITVSRLKVLFIFNVDREKVYLTKEIGVQ